MAIKFEDMHVAYWVHSDGSYVEAVVLAPEDEHPVWVSDGGERYRLWDQHITSRVDGYALCRSIYIIEGGEEFTKFHQACALDFLGKKPKDASPMMEVVERLEGLEVELEAIRDIALGALDARPQTS